MVPSSNWVILDASVRIKAHFPIPNRPGRIPQGTCPETCLWRLGPFFSAASLNNPHDLLISLTLSNWRSKGRASSIHPLSQSSKSSAVHQLRLLRGQSQNKSCLRDCFMAASLLSHFISTLLLSPHDLLPCSPERYEAYSGSHSYPTAETVPTQLLVIQKAQVGDNNVFLIPQPNLNSTSSQLHTEAQSQSHPSGGSFLQCPDFYCLGEQGQVREPSWSLGASFSLFFIPRYLEMDGSFW